MLLEEHTASSSATLDFTTFISSTYDEYLFEGLGVAPASDQVNLNMLVGTGGGPTYDAGANYYGSISGLGSSGGARVDHVIAAATSGYLIGWAVSNGAGYGQCSFSMRLIAPQSTALMKYIHGTAVMHSGGSGGAVVPSPIGGLWAVTTALTAVRFLFASGNIASGTIRVYGLAK